MSQRAGRGGEKVAQLPGAGDGEGFVEVEAHATGTGLPDEAGGVGVVVEPTLLTQRHESLTDVLHEPLVARCSVLII